MTQVLDYSAGFPGGAAIARAGYAGAVRYCGFPDRRKCTNADELADFTANRIGMALVFEDQLTTWRGGKSGGAASMSKARAHANTIGFPRSRPIYLAIDQDVVTSGEFGTMLDYLAGAGEQAGGAGLVGVYGEADVIDRARDAGLAKFFWQTAAWSRGRTTTAHLYQHVGAVTVGKIACDVNDVKAADWGQHSITQGGWLMALTDQQQQELYNWVGELRNVFGQYYALRRDNVGDADEHTIGAAIYDIEDVLGDAWKNTVSIEAGNQGVSIGKQVATLYKRPAATVRLDDQAIATVTAQLLQALADKNIGGATPEQVTEIVRAAFARGGQA